MPEAKVGHESINNCIVLYCIALGPFCSLSRSLTICLNLIYDFQTLWRFITLDEILNLYCLCILTLFLLIITTALCLHCLKLIFSASKQPNCSLLVTICRNQKTGFNMNWSLVAQWSALSKGIPSVWLSNSGVQAEGSTKPGVPMLGVASLRAPYLGIRHWNNC